MFTNLNRCYIIAEIGGNFTTYPEAVALIDAAVAAGADCVKLQTFRAETIVSRKAMFDMENTGRISQYDYFRKYEISAQLHRQIVDYLEEKGVDWLSTPSHESDVDLLLSLGCRALKIGADDATNLPLLRYAAATGLPVVLSTGMCTLPEVREAVDTMLAQGNRNLVILHTVSGYPTYPDQVNLGVLATYRREFPGFYLGFSDHTLSPLASIAAATLGAQVVERHFTLDKEGEGPDHRISATPEELRYIVASIREIERMLGDGVKMPVGPEVGNRINNRKSLHTLRPVRAGELLGAGAIGVRRPGGGIEPKHLDLVLGRRAARDLPPDEPLCWGDLG